jgi:O-antigen/teichoic acid export membrane protein
MPQRRTARGTVQLLISQFCLFVSGYVITVLLARGLGPEDYGLYGLILSLLFWIEQLSWMGLPQATAKLIAEDHRQDRRVAPTAWLLGAILFAVVFALFWGATPLLTRLFQIPEAGPLFRLAALDIPCFGLYHIYRGVSEGRREFATLSLAGGIYGVAKAVGVLGLYAFGLSIEGALIVNILGSLIALIVIASRTPVPVRQWHIPTVAPLLRLACPLALGVLIASALYHLDLWSLQVFLPGGQPPALGVYLAASQIARMPSLGVLAITLVLFSSIAQALGRHDRALAQRYVQQGVRFLMVVLFPAAVLIAIEAEELMEFVYTNQYVSGGAFLRVLIFGYSLFVFLSTFLTVLQASGAHYIGLGIGGGLVGLMLLLSWVLIPRHGPLGAAYAMTITMGIGILLTGFTLSQRFGKVVRPSVCLKVLVATTCLGILAALISAPGALLPLLHIGLLGIYLLILALLGELRREDLRPFALWRMNSSRAPSTQH